MSSSHNPCAAFKRPPYKIEEEGWGEFDMEIVFYADGRDYAVTHDLNFQTNRYEAKHTIVSLAGGSLNEH